VPLLLDDFQCRFQRCRRQIQRNLRARRQQARSLQLRLRLHRHPRRLRHLQLQLPSPTRMTLLWVEKVAPAPNQVAAHKLHSTCQAPCSVQQTRASVSCARSAARTAPARRTQVRARLGLLSLARGGGKLVHISAARPRPQTRACLGLPDDETHNTGYCTRHHSA